MGDHYYTAEPGSVRNVRSHKIEVLGVSLMMLTDTGVFSKDGLDEGSRLLLETLPPLEGRVLDMGCGWGAIGLTLSLVNPGTWFILSDVNARAIELCERNRRANALMNAQVFLSDGVASVEGEFDAVITNPPIRAGKKVIYRLFEEGFARLKPGGSLYVVIRKQQGAESALAFLTGLSENAERIARDKGFWVLKCGKDEGK
ncbi:MAG: methyltransferase [Clostridia bacterium]